MSIKTSARARTSHDRAGDPLDGLVNLFDLGIVLAVAFLLAALSSVKLTPAVLQNGEAPPITVGKDQTTRPLNLDQNQRVVGRGTQVGAVYRLANGKLIYVAPKDGTATTPAPATTTAP